MKAQQQEEVADITYSFVSRNVEAFRALPLWTGAIGVVGLLANRSLSGVAPVVDASSSQSRADVLGIAMAAVLLLTGLQWLSLKPRVIPAVELEGAQVYYQDKLIKLPAEVTAEIRWAWDALRSCTRCKSLVLIYKDYTLLHAGYVRAGREPGNAKPGVICQQAMASGKGNYLANMILYPGRPEFTEFLPENTQGVVVQPVGKAGVLIAATDTVRGFSGLDQAWCSLIADKLEAALEPLKLTPSGAGFGSSNKA